LLFGYSRPEASLGDIASRDISQNVDGRVFWTAASLKSQLTGDLLLDLSIRYLSQVHDFTNNSLGLGQNGPRGDLFMANLYDERNIGATGKLVFERLNHVVVAGVDFDRGKLDHDVSLGPVFTGIEEAPNSTYRSSIDKWAIFANDTITLGDWTITPGLRCDWNNRTGSFFSPSLGLVYAAGRNTLLRGSVGRGFSIPPIYWTTGGALFLDPNPSLDVEKVWSFQAGVESRALKYVWLKATAFHHEIEDAITPVPVDPSPSN
ncbi:MAG: TonB-dependent receptor, partial [Desulfobacterales bacterium]|nr:TonB-dependent receptor [Desulfobacterales bacterium]